MTTFIDLKTRVGHLVDDSSMTTLIESFINQGVFEIAGGIQSSLGDWITPPLPNLFLIDTVTTLIDTAYVDMPSTYHRGLQLIVSASGREIDIAHSFIEFIETYPALDSSGNISEVVEHGNKLYYQGIPTAAEDVILHFYRKPIAMDDDLDEPDGIPEHLQISLLTNFAAWKAWELIEDGDDGERPNTFKFENAFIVAMKTLELTIPDYIRGLMLK